jgi:hypothetical protein
MFAFPPINKRIFVEPTRALVEIGAKIEEAHSKGNCLSHCFFHRKRKKTLWMDPVGADNADSQSTE